eukprot:g5577.t1
MVDYKKHLDTAQTRRHLQKEIQKLREVRNKLRIEKDVQLDRVRELEEEMKVNLADVATAKLRAEGILASEVNAPEVDSVAIDLGDAVLNSAMSGNAREYADMASNLLDAARKEAKKCKDPSLLLNRLSDLKVLRRRLQEKSVELRQDVVELKGKIQKLVPEVSKSQQLLRFVPRCDIKTVEELRAQEASLLKAKQERKLKNNIENKNSLSTDMKANYNTLASANTQLEVASDENRSVRRKVATTKHEIQLIETKIASERAACRTLQKERDNNIKVLWSNHWERVVPEVFDLHQDGSQRLNSEAAARALVDACAFDKTILLRKVEDVPLLNDIIGEEEKQLAAAVAVVASAEKELGEFAPYSLRAFESIWRLAGAKSPSTAKRK